MSKLYLSNTIFKPENKMNIEVTILILNEVDFRTKILPETKRNIL